MGRSKPLTLIVFLLLAVPAIGGQQAASAELLRGLGDYAARFLDDVANLVAEERYVQDVAYRNLPPNRFAGQTHRELRSDVLLVRPGGSEQSVEFRDVFEVDGRLVRDRQERLTKLFLDPSASAEAQIRQIHGESARYNIGNVERTINTPMLPLQFVLPRQQSRFRFTRDRDGAAAPIVIRFDEVQRPTVIRTPAGLDLPAHGRFWVDAAGRITMTELVTDDTSLRATIQVRYEWDVRAQHMIPTEMRERYEVRRDGALITGVATYGNVRRFQVTADERLGRSADRPPSETAPPPIEPTPSLIEPTPSPADASPTPAPPSASALSTTPRDADAPARPPTFRSLAELVLVDFVVTDRSGRAVSGLSAKDIVVKEDGKERPIVSFEAFAAGAAGALDKPTVNSQKPPPGTATTVVLVDDLHLTPAQAARLRPALRGLLTTVGGRGAVMLVAPASNVSIFTESPAADGASLVERLAGGRTEDQTTFPIADAEALAIARRDNPTLARVVARVMTLNPELSADQAETLAIERGIAVAHQARVRRDTMYDVMLQCLDWLAGRPGRHRVVLVSGGFATEIDDAKYFEVVTRSLRANAPIDVLDARGLSGFDRYHDVEFGPALSRAADEGPLGRFEAGEGPTGLAVDTGGLIVSNSNDMRRGLDQLLDAMTTYYLVGYQPPAHSKAGFRRIKVEVRGKGLRVRARTGYQSP